jgi:hypothetical protein
LFLLRGRDPGEELYICRNPGGGWENQFGNPPKFLILEMENFKSDTKRTQKVSHYGSGPVFNIADNPNDCMTLHFYKVDIFAWGNKLRKNALHEMKRRKKSSPFLI